jgi:hypothetical protein
MRDHHDAVARGDADERDKADERGDGKTPPVKSIAKIAPISASGMLIITCKAERQSPSAFKSRKKIATSENIVAVTSALSLPAAPRIARRTL